jgi:hypothetical protein
LDITDIMLAKQHKGLAPNHNIVDISMSDSLTYQIGKNTPLLNSGTDDSNAMATEENESALG